MCFTNEECLPASVVNGVSRIVNGDCAQNLSLKSETPTMTSCSSECKSLNIIGKQKVVWWVSAKETPGHYHMDWLLGQAGSVSIVRLCGKNAEHMVFVEAEKRQVLDSVERFPLRLCRASFTRCVGDSKCLVCVSEVRHLVFCLKSKRKNKNGSSKRNKENRRSDNWSILNLFAQNFLQFAVSHRTVQVLEWVCVTFG